MGKKENIIGGGVTLLVIEVVLYEVSNWNNMSSNHGNSRSYKKITKPQTLAFTKGSKENKRGWLWVLLASRLAVVVVTGLKNKTEHTNL